MRNVFLIGPFALALAVLAGSAAHAGTTTIEFSPSTASPNETGSANAGAMVVTRTSLWATQPIPTITRMVTAG